MKYLTNYWAVSFHFCCNDIYQPKNIIDIKMVQNGADVGEIWRIGSEMLGSCHGQLDVCAATGYFQAWVFNAAASGC